MKNQHEQAPTLPNLTASEALSETRKVQESVITAQIEGDGFDDTIQFTVAEVMQHHMPGSVHGWTDLSEQDQTSFAEDFALWKYARQYGRQDELRVEVTLPAVSAEVHRKVRGAVQPTPLEEAVRQLHAAGYPASPSGLYPESVKVVVGPKAIDTKHLKLVEIEGFLAKNPVGPQARKVSREQQREELNRVKYVIHSMSEGAELAGVVGAFWSNKDGWGSLETATRFTTLERMDRFMPISAGGDSEWMLLEEALDLTRKLVENEFYAGVTVGSQVYWVDPDNGFSSGYYTVHEIYAESGSIEADDTMLMLKNEAGGECEVFAHELRPMAPAVLNDAQLAVLQQYEGGEFAHLCEVKSDEELKQALEDCGDGLLRFLMVELASSEDCDSLQEAQRRIEAAVRQMQSASDAIYAVEQKTNSSPSFDM